MNKIYFAIIMSLSVSSVQAEVPSMCLDGTYAGGPECDLTIDGNQVWANLVPDDFFVTEDEFAKELGDIYKDLHDKIIKKQANK